MGRNGPSLQHALIQRVLPQEVENKNTEKAYKKQIKNFATWAKENGYKRPDDITRDVVQEYERYLERQPKRYGAATIHTYLTPVCAAAGVRMDLIDKPRRTAGTITRGRDRDASGVKLDRNP